MLSTPSRRNAGLKPISSGSPRKSQGSDSRPSPTSCVWAEIVSSPGANASRSGERPASTSTRAMTSANSPFGSDTSCSNVSGSRRRNSGNWPSMRRAPSHTSAGAEEHLVLLDDDLQSRSPPTAAEIRSRSASARCGDDRRERLRRAAVERRRAHRHAVGVGRGHRQRRRPANSTRTPVSTGRESSREAARSTRSAACRNVSRVDVEGAARDRSPAGAGSRRRHRCGASTGSRRTRASAGRAPRRTPA